MPDKTKRPNKRAKKGQGKASGTEADDEGRNGKQVENNWQVNT